MSVNTAPLKAAEAYWDPAKPEVIALLGQNPEGLSKEDLLVLVRELDRRFMQLWDKVAFERQHGLVDYGQLPGRV